MCTPAPACRKALDEASERWPNRSRASDGICPSAAHRRKSPKSDHNSGNAFDLTHDPSHGADCNVLAEYLRQSVLAGQETRVKYIIWNRRIFNPSVSQNWRTYQYSYRNPHTSHMHVSIHAHRREDVNDWWSGVRSRPQSVTRPQEPPSPQHDHPTPLVKVDRSPLDGKLHGAVYHPEAGKWYWQTNYQDAWWEIKDVQTHLGIPADGVGGPQTRQAILDFQRRHGLQADGVVGPQTWSHLHR